MSGSLSAHPTDQTLQSFVQKDLDSAAAEAISGHLVGCATCRARASVLSSNSASGGRPRPGDRPESAPPVGSSLDLETKNVETVGSEGSVHPDTLPPGLADHPDYQVIRELGRGGMGVVYLASNKLMGRDEVLKVMGRHIIEKPGVLERFLREIRAVAKLRHPNIVTAYSAFRLPDSIVFAMEYVDGYDLSKLVKTKGPLSVVHACYFIHQAALGLQHAHEEGMVHRDIKPGNLMLSRKGDRATIKILDFGLAKATREQPLDRGLTQEGQMLGTPDYIAPEQTLDAQKADIRADIYSLGCTLYYLLKGSPPFQASSLFEVLQSHQSREAKPLDQVRGDVPAELTAVVARMMAKEPEHRFQTPAEVAKALMPFFKGGKSAPPVTSKDPFLAVSPLPISPQSHVPVSPKMPTAQSTPPTPRATVPSLSGAADPEVGASWPRLAQDPEARVNPATAPFWTWPSVAAGVLLLGALFAWAAGALSSKSPDVRIEPKGETNPVTIPDRQVQSKAGIPVSASPPKSSSLAMEPKVDSRPTNGQLPGSLASVGKEIREPTKTDGDLRRQIPREGLPNNPGGRPKMPPSTDAKTGPSSALVGPSSRPALPQGNSSGSRGFSQEPVDVLKANGLLKSGRFFVLPDEEKVIQELVHMLPVMIQVEGKYNAWRAILQNEAEFQWLDEYKIQVTGQLNDFRVAFNNMPQRNPLEKLQKQEAAQQLAAYENEIRLTNSELELHRKRLVGPAAKQKAEDDAKKACEKFLEVKSRVWPDVEAILKRYDELKSNDSVSNALRAYDSKVQAHLKLGPSDDMYKKAKMVIAYERNYSPETAPRVKKPNRNKALDKKKKRDKLVSSETGKAMADK